MKQLGLFVTSFIFTVILGMGSVSAAVITFDDFTIRNSAFGLGNYGGLDWGFAGVFKRGVIRGNHGYNTGTVSGDYVAYSSDSVPMTVSGLGSFQGAYLTSLWRNDLDVLVEAIAGGIVVDSRTVVVNTTGPIWFDFNFTKIDQVRLSGSGGTVADERLPGFSPRFVMDNFTFEFPEQDIAVPAPAATGLILLGLAGLLQVRWKRISN